MGGPSAAIVIEELIDLGARTLVRIGTCGALAAASSSASWSCAREVLAADGTSAALGRRDRLRRRPRAGRGAGDAGRPRR